MATTTKKKSSKKKISKTIPVMKLAGTSATNHQEKRWDVCKVWTKKLGKPFTPVSSYFIENYHRLPYPINANEFLLIVHLLKYKWDEAMPHPAIPTLAKKMLKSEQAVRAAARGLERKEYLIRHIQRGKTNHFDLQPLFNAIEKLYDADIINEQKENKGRRRRRSSA